MLCSVAIEGERCRLGQRGWCRGLKSEGEARGGWLTLWECVESRWCHVQKPEEAISIGVKM